jgi:hypothetical protein
MPRRFAPHKYEPLTRYLPGFTFDEVMLLLAEVEQIIGTQLPATARYPSFWSSGTQGVSGVRPWVQAGWRMARTDLRRRTPMLMFGRVASEAIAEPCTPHRPHGRGGGWPGGDRGSG